MPVQVHGHHIIDGAFEEDIVILSDWETGKDGWIFHPVGGAGGGPAQTTEELYHGNGSLKYTSDFSSGGAYTIIYTHFPTPQPLEEFRFWVKTEDYAAIPVRVTDWSGETFQRTVMLDATTEWQQVVITQFHVQQLLGRR